MRCLLCGNPLSVLQKFTDSDFCSAEHRKQFFTEQQRLIRDRLIEAAERLRRHVERASRPPVVPPKQQDAPAPVAPFLLSCPALANQPAQLEFFGPLDSGDLPLIPPPLGFTRIPVNLATQWIADLPWPKYNPGLWFCHQLDSEDTSEQFMTVARMLAAWTPFSVRWSPNGLTPLRRPDLFLPQHRALAGAFAPEQLGPAAHTVYRVRLPNVQKVVRVPSATRLYRVRPVAIGLAPDLIRIDSGALASRPAVPVIPSFRPRHSAPKPAVLDRFYRSRSRGGVMDASTEGTHAGTVEPLTREQQPVNLGLTQHSPLLSAPVTPALSLSSCQPVVVERFFRARPRGPLSSTLPQFEQLQPGVCTLNTGRPVFNERARIDAADCRPIGTGRLIQPDLERVTRSGVPGLERRLPTPANPKAGRLVHPVLTSEAEQPCEPVLVASLFRARPRGPVGNGVAALEPNPGPGPFSGSGLTATVDLAPLVPGIELVECAPGLVDRCFRWRPRAGVAGSVNLQAPPLPAVHVPFTTAPERRIRTAGPRFHTFAPATLDRLFRFRPRGPVGCAILPAAVVAECSPLMAERTPLMAECMFRPGVTESLSIPKWGFESGEGFSVPPPARLDTQLGTTSVVGLGSRPVSPQSSFRIVMCVPPGTDRLFRPRPRGPVDCAVPSRGTIPAEGVPSAAGRPRVQSPLHNVDCRPIMANYAVRLPQIRPADAPMRMIRIQASSLLVPERPVAVLQTLGACEPNWALRLFRLRLRPAAGTDPAGRAANLKLGSFHADAKLGSFHAGGFLSSGSGKLGSFRAGVVFATFGPDALGILAPAFLNRLYRMRPRHPLQDPSTLAQSLRCRYLPVADPEPLRATMPVDCITSRGPALFDRLYRMRPRAGRDIPNLAQAIEAAPLPPVRHLAADGAPEPEKELLNALSRRRTILEPNRVISSSP